MVIDMKVACKHLDRLVSVQLRPTDGDALYELYQLLDGDGPVSWQMAQAILERPGCAVGVAAGGGGLRGAAVLARALDRLGYPVTLYVPSASVEEIRTLEETLKTAVPVEELGADGKDTIDGMARRLDVCIFVEMPGVDEHGAPCQPDGMDCFSADALARSMNELGKITMGICSELEMAGFGKLFPEAKKVVPAGRAVSRTVAAYLYPVSDASWGAYALTAALAIGREQSGLALLPEEEEAMLRTGAPADRAVSAGVVRMIQEMVDITLTTNDRKF